jgi:predicted metal-dependent peptidase
MPARNRGGGRRPSRAVEQRHLGLRLISEHPLFAPLADEVAWYQEADRSECPAAGWAVVSSTGAVHLHPARLGEAAEWAWVAAHALLHLGFGHLAQRHRAGWTAAGGAARDAGFDAPWNLAGCLAVNRFLAHLKVGRPPTGLGAPTAFDHLVATLGSEESCAARFRERGTPGGLAATCGTGGPGGDLVWTGGSQGRAGGVAGALPVTWADLLAAGLADAAATAVDVAGGAAGSLSGGRGHKTRWRLALDWFIASYPLLGGLAAAFKLVEDAEVCRRASIGVAAISPAAAELYVNPLSGLSLSECRFVIAHELLHAGLRHDTRGAGRHPWLWNVACDFVINGWLTEMEVGDRPAGTLHDPALRGLSAEAVYDRIAADARRFRKVATLRGVALGDVLPRPLRSDPLDGVDLDEFYRRSLADGLAWCRGQRGLIPAGLIEEIRALAQPPVPWDVELARWFDAHFLPLERRRSYARASRRQSATPDIPRPGRYVPEEETDRRTFGVVLDTSGSMDARLLGKALGAVASYAVSREVPAVRVVFCDAAAHDAGWLEPAEIAGRVEVRGRGGTVLQPGVDLLQEAPDFPRTGPILVITDGWCDQVRVRREHAYLIPADAMLPFVPRGPVFRFA